MSGEKKDEIAEIKKDVSRISDCLVALANRLDSGPRPSPSGPTPSSSGDLPSIYRKRSDAPTSSRATARPASLLELAEGQLDGCSQVAGIPRGACAPILYPPRLPDRILEKIERDEYVDFFEILYPENRKFGVVLADNERELNLVSKKSKALSEAQWNKAFALFSLAYIDTYPDATKDLLLYGMKVNELMINPLADWRTYDYEFRKTRKKNGLTWAHLRLDLEISAVSHLPGLRRSKDSGQPFRAGRGREEIPAGYCFDFHSPHSVCQQRASCKYRHDCAKCKSRHPMFKACPKPGKSSKTSSQTQRSTPPNPSSA